MGRIDAAGSLLQVWQIIHRVEEPWYRKPIWRIPVSNLALYTCLALVMLFLVRNMFSNSTVRWHHAPLTAKLKFRQGGEMSLSQLCKSITPPCFLNPLMRSSHLQTLFFMFDNRAYPLYFQRRIFESENPNYQGTFAVDFSTSPFDGQDPSLPPRTMLHEESHNQDDGSDDSKPMLITLHGLCGGSHELYLQHVLAPLVACKQGWEVCVVLSRGCGESSITGGGMYYAHATSDLRQVIKWIASRFPNRSLYGAGFSMGANILTRYIAEEGDDCKLKAAVVVSNPWNLETTALHLQRTFWGRWLYSPAMTTNLMKVYWQHAQKIETVDGHLLDTEPANQVKLLHEYDRLVQCPTWGFPTERAYYRQASSSDSVLDVRIPFFAINAEDDPIVGSESLPKGEFEVSPYTIMCTTDGGGHLGWFQPDGKRWYVSAMVSFYQRMHAVREVATEEA